MLKLLILSLLFPILTFSKIKDQLELLLDMQAGDSVLAISQLGPDKISVLIFNTVKTEKRTLESTLTPITMGKLKATAESETIPWTVIDIQPEPASANTSGNQNERKALVGAPVSSSDNEEKISKSALSKNKFRYVSTQTVFSTYTYGIALPIAFSAPDKAGALALLALPISFGAHYYFAWEKDYYDSHLLATSYFATNALIFSYALPYLVLGNDDNAFRIGSFALLGAYPLGLYYGYKHGTRFQDEPGRVSLQSSFAASMGFMGFAAIFLWPHIVKSEDNISRLILAQTLGAGIAGHYLSYNYRTHERVPGGIGPGIGTFSLLGGLVSASLLTSIQPDSLEAIGAILLGGVGAGFLGGQKYFFDKYDSFERSAYNSLGLIAGAVTPLGIMRLASSEDIRPKVWMWSATGGAFAGYFLTRYFTSSLVESPHSLTSENGFFKSIAFNPCPVPVPEYLYGKHSIKFVAPIFSATF